MNKEQITKALEWTPEELKKLKEMKEEKANTLLLQLINNEDEAGAFTLVFDKTLEVNAQIHNNNYTPLLLAIKKGMNKLVIESFTNENIKYKLNINRKNNKDLYESLGESNSIELYDFFENFKHNKEEMLADTLFYALGYGKLDLIKHLINKKVDGNYHPVNLRRAAYGYSTYNTKEEKEEIKQYLSFFADIEKHTENNYINDESKETFFSTSLLIRIILKNDSDSLDFYRKIVPENNFKKHIADIIKEQMETQQGRIIEALKWLLVNTTDIDLSSEKSIKKSLAENEELLQLYNKNTLNYSLSEKLTQKNIKEKTHKI